MAATRENPVINSQYLQPQHEWGWQVALYLYLAGMGAGATMMGLLADWLGYSPYASRAILLWGPLMVGVGALFLLLKLGIKRRFMNTVMNPMTSWLSRGFYILSVCILAGTAILAISLAPLVGIDVDGLSTTTSVLNIVVFIFSLATAVYTGILIQAVKYVSFWHTYMLPVLFTVSALSTGAVATLLVTQIYDLAMFEKGYSTQMAGILMNTEQILMVIELVVLGLFLYGRYKAQEGQARSSVLLLMFGKYRLVFWLGIVGCGFIFPLILENFNSMFAENAFLLYAAFACVLTSGLLLRMGIIYSGIKDQTPLHKAVEMQYFLKFEDTGTIPLRME